MTPPEKLTISAVQGAQNMMLKHVLWKLFSVPIKTNSPETYVSHSF
jgi:hypothetical protein